MAGLRKNQQGLGGGHPLEFSNGFIGVSGHKYHVCSQPHSCLQKGPTRTFSFSSLNLLAKTVLGSFIYLFFVMKFLGVRGFSGVTGAWEEKWGHCRV